MAFTGPLEDRLLIRELYNSYSDSSFRQDVDAYLACWHDDGVRLSRHGELRGKPALRAAWDEIWTTLERMAFFAEVGAIEVNGDAATSRCYCREIIELKTGEFWKVVGLYEDKLIRHDGQWLFQERRYSLLLNERKD